MGFFDALKPDISKDIRPDEQVFGQFKDIQCNIIAGKDDKNIFGKETFTDKRTGVLVITDKRIFFKSKKGITENTISLEVNLISNVDVKDGMLTSEITIYSGSGSRLELTRVFRQMVDELKACIGKAQSGAPATPSQASNNAADIPEQIKKLSKLKDEGILSAEEFDKKKSELLAKM